MKNKLRNIIVLSIAVFLVLYFSLRNNYTEVVETFKNINKLYLLLALILTLTVTYIKGLVLHFLSKVYKKDNKIKDSVILAYETNFFNGITPFSTGGQPYQVLKLNNSGYKLADATNIIIQSSITFQIATLFVVIFSVLYNKSTGVLESNLVLNRFVMLGFLITLFFVSVVIAISLSNKVKSMFLKITIKIINKLKFVKNKEERISDLKKYVEEFDEGIDKLFENKRIFVLCVILQILALIIYYITPLVVFLGLGIDIGLIVGLVTFSYVVMAGSFIPLPGSTGGIEFAFIRFFSNFAAGGPLHAVMLLWRTITYYFNIAIGAIILGTKKD